jgi:hypothetical protein
MGLHCSLCPLSGQNQKPCAQFAARFLLGASDAIPCEVLEIRIDTHSDGFVWFFFDTPDM